MGLFSKKESGPDQHLIDLINQGILYEDEFVDTYSKLLQETEFAGMFGNRVEEVKEKLTLLITESQGHKGALEKILREIQ